MKKKTASDQPLFQSKIKFGLLALTAFISGCAFTNKHHTHWGYEGHHGPKYWGTMNSDYATCKNGVNQSPIDLTELIEAELPPLGLAYKPGGTEVINNGHSIQVNYQPGSNLSIGEQVFELKQFHFHTPSENQINGHSFPLEVHLVHVDKDGRLAVVAVLFKEGEKNQTIKNIWDAMPNTAGEKNMLQTIISADNILPTHQDYYRYNGSLTTPPCSEGVTWLVMKQPLSVSKQQIKKFESLLRHPNNRPIQPVNARPVLK
jgi:carbonic anhydrase